MGLGSGRPVRIPFPQRRAGFKKPADYYHKKKGAPEYVPPHLRLKGQPRTRALRKELRREAGLLRNPIRWGVVLLLWLVFAWTFFTTPFTRMSGLHFFCGLSFALVWFAGFALNPSTRVITSLFLGAAGILGLVTGQPVINAIGVLFSAIVLICMSLPQAIQATAYAAEKERDRQVRRGR